MKKTKQSLIAFVVMLTFLMTSLLPLPSVFAGETPNITFSATMDEDNNLEITVNGADGKAFVDSVNEVRIMGNLYLLAQSNSGYIFTTEENKIKIEDSPSIFKENLIEMVSSEYGIQKFNFENPKGVSLADGLTISGIVAGESGKSEIINGEELGDFAKYVGFRLKYKYDNVKGSNLFSLTKQIEKVNFDGVDYPRLDEKGDANFVLWEKSLNAYNKYPAGIKLYNDFLKNGGEQGKHRVELFFKDKTSVFYEDEGYVAPNSNEGEVSNDDPAPPAPSEGSLGAKHPISGITFDKANDEVRIALKDFTRAVSNKIQKVRINGQDFGVDKFGFSLAHDDYYSNDKAVYKKATEKETIDLRVHFEDGSIAQYNKPVQLPTPDISLKYEIGEVSLSKTEFRLTFNEKAKANGQSIGKRLDTAAKNPDLVAIKSVTINGTRYNGPDSFGSKFEVNGNALISTDSEILENAARLEEADLAIAFSDQSVISAKKRVTKTGGSTAPEVKQNANIEPKDAVVSETRLTLSFKEGKTLKSSDLANVKELSVNGQNYLPNLFALSEETLISTNNDVVKKAKEKSPIKVVITFKDDSQVFFNKDAVQTDNPGTITPPVTPNEKPQIVSVEVVKGWGDPELVVTFNKDIPTNQSRVFKESIANIEVNGTAVDPTLFFINYEGKLKTSDKDVLTKAKERKPITLKIVFKDGDEISKDLNTPPEVTPEEGLTLASNLADGDYTLSYRAYKKGTTEGSVLEDFFDKRAKLHVENGKKTVTFLNYVYADLMLDFAVTDDNVTKSASRKVTRTRKGGEAAAAEFSIELSKLTGKFDVYILGTGPMGGRRTDIGNYTSESYKQLDLVFDNKVTAGFTDFIKNEEYKEKRAQNDKILTEALIQQDFDKDKDGKITPEELRQGKGAPAKLIEDTKVPNVLNLEGLGLIDISMLKDLGPGVEHLNLDGNDIEFLPEGLLDHATGLQRIFLGGNELSAIPADLFKNTTELTYLDLDGNPLTTIPQGLFKNTKELQILAIMNNKLTSVPDDLIKNAPKLRELYLRNNPELASLSDDFFSGQKATYLSRVELGRTSITSIPSSLNGKKALRLLGAQNCKIETLPDLSGLTGIERVDFEGNYINTFPLGLYKTMVKRAKTHSLSGHVKLDLSLNDIKELPLAEMQANSDGAKRMVLQVDRNYLKTPLTSKEEKEHQDLGISFKQGSDDTYYPQKGESKFTATAENGTITLTSAFDSLEMYYWHLGDVRGKGKFKTADEFLNYLQGEGRVINGVSKALPRDEGIKKIFEAKDLTWKVETSITKNNGIKVFEAEAVNEKEGTTQTFKDNGMRVGDNYTLTKVFYRRSASGWTSEMTLKANFVAGGENLTPEVTKVPVVLYKKGTNNPSMASATLRPQADVEQRGDKFYYTVYLKPLSRAGLTVEVSKLYYLKDGVKTPVLPQVVGGEYPKAYTMEFNAPQTRAAVSFETSPDIVGEQQADLVFGALPPQELPTEKTVKGYIVATKEDKMSMADQAMIRDVLYTEDEAFYTFNVGFKPMTLQGETAKVDRLYLKRGEQLLETTKNTEKEGYFTFKLPKAMVDKNQDTKLPVAFTLAPAVNGHDRPLDAKLLLDWNGDFTPIGNVPTPTPNTGVFNAYILTKDKKALSMADKAFERKTSYVDIDGWRNITLRFKPLTLQGQQAKVTKIQYEAMGDYRNMVKDKNEEGVFTFKMPVFATQMEAGREVKLFFTLEPKVPGHDKPIEAVLVLDWNNSFKPPVDNNPPSGGGDTPGSSEVSSNIPVWAKNPSTGERSMADKSLRPIAKVVQSNGSYTYTVGFKPITIPFGGKDVTGNIIEVSAVKDGSEETMREAGRDGDYTLYSVTLNNKVDELPIRFDVDIMKDLGGGKKEAILVLDWSGQSSAPTNEGTAGGGGGAVPELISKKLEGPVVKLKEKVTLTRPTSGYMKGYQDGSFKPNKNITRAESAMVFAQFVDLSKVKNEGKLIYAKKDAWYENAMEKLYTLGLWDAQQKATHLVIKPDEMITRAELAQVIASLKGLEYAKTKKTFTDLNQNHWANDAIMACVEAGIISGYKDGSVKPDNKITRAEFVSMMNRAFKKENSGVKQMNYTDVKAGHWAYDAINAASN